MSVGSKSLPARRGGDGGENGAVARDEDGLRRGGSTRSRKQQKGARYDRWFSGRELSIGSGPLKDMDSRKLKDQIRKWAKAVVAFARQISFGGSPRSVTTTSSSSDDTPRSASATFPAASRQASRLGGAKNEPPVTA